VKAFLAALAALVEVLNTAFPRPPAPRPPAVVKETSSPGPETDSPGPVPDSPPPEPRPAPEGPGGGELLGSFEATCYALTGATASGAPAGPGSIAVDRSVIPLGTALYVEGYGHGDARDTGGAIRGRRVDVWLSTVAACRAWGRRSVLVWRLP
jgi:3D (Asp-Asp-Asp) domain-containing protein